MLNFFHKLLNPHCPHCREIELEARVCNSCEAYKDEINRLLALNDMLLKKALSSPEAPIIVDSTEFPIITRSRRPALWSIEQQRLEKESREKAATIREQKQKEEAEIAEKQRIENLERELGVS